MEKETNYDMAEQEGLFGIEDAFFEIPPMKSTSLFKIMLYFSLPYSVRLRILGNPTQHTNMRT